MISLMYSTKRVATEGPAYLVATVDSGTDWDAEVRGDEPGYPQFVDFLARLVCTLGSGGSLYGSFTERKARTSSLTQLPDAGRRQTRFPIHLPERVLAAVLGKIAPRLSGMFCSGVALELESHQQVVEIVGAKERPNEWLFFVVDPQSPIAWSTFCPWYLVGRGCKPTRYDAVSAARYVVFHEAAINYCEVLCAGEADAVISAAAADCAGKAGITLERSE